MAVKTWVNGDRVAAVDLNRWEQAAGGLSRAGHAPSLGRYFPEAEGATGTGMGNDQPGLTSALTAAANKGVVDLKRDSTYALASLLTIPAGSIIEGNGATIKLSGAGRTQGIQFTGPATVRNVIFDFQQIPTSNCIQVLATANGSKMQGCTFTHGNGVETSNVTGISIMAVCDIDACTFVNIANPVRVSGAVDGVEIIANTFSNWTGRCIYIVGTSTAAASNLKINGNVIYPLSAAALETQPRQPIAFQGNDDNMFKAVQISHNIVFGPGASHDPTADQLAAGGQYGTADQISVHQADGFTVIGNQSYDGGDVGITVAVECRHGVITGNVCNRNDSVGICVGSRSSTDLTHNIAVTGNTCMNNGQNRAGDAPDFASTGISVAQGDSIIVTGNRCGDTQTAKTQVWGIGINTSPRVTVGTNDLLDNRDGQIYVGSGSMANGTLIFNMPGARSVLAADSSPVNNSTTFVPSGLSLPVDPGGIYELSAFIIYSTSPTADMQIRFNGPAGASLSWVPAGPGANAASQTNALINRGNSLLASAQSLGGATSARAVASPVGVLATAVTAGGTLSLSFAQNTADPSDTLIGAGSWIKLTRIG